VWLEVDSGKVAFSRPAHSRVTQTIGRFLPEGKVFDVIKEIVGSYMVRNQKGDIHGFLQESIWQKRRR
jgi:hypothetical protein